MVSSHTENTKRIAKNTLMLYVRMLFGMLVSLYTSRVILEALGVEDYGIYNVVGGFVAMFSIISGSLSASVSRFLTFELGRGDMQRLRDVFSTSVLIHIVLAIVILLATESIGIWFLNTQMNIPQLRLHAANYVFQASILSFVISLLNVPYNASIIAHERMSAYAYIGITDIILRLVVVLIIAGLSTGVDKLIVYALLLLIERIIFQSISFFYCKKNFEECNLFFVLNRSCWKEMSSFAGWNFIGTTSALLKDSGVNVLLNIFAGPVVNAARGIATSVNMAVCSFSSSFMSAINPQITKSYASGDREYMLSLSERGTRFSFYIILLFALPVILETDFLLAFWLKQYPPHTVDFVRLVLLLSLCDVMSNTLVTMQLATGKIRDYQIVVGCMQLMNFPLSYICLKCGLSPESVYIIAILVSLSCLILRLFFLRKFVGLSIGKYFKNVCANVVLVMAISAIIPIVVHNALQYGWIRFVIVTSISLICIIMVAYYVGCDKSERKFVNNKIRTFKIKLT